MECKTSSSRGGSDGHSGRQRIYATPRGSLMFSLLGPSTPSLKTLYPRVLAILPLDVKLETLCPFESSVTICQSKWRNILENLALHSNGFIKDWGNPKYMDNQQMHFNIYDVCYSKCSHQRVLSGIPAIFKVKLLLKEQKHTNLAKCVTITPQTIKIRISVKIM